MNNTQNIFVVSGKSCKFAVEIKQKYASQNRQESQKQNKGESYG